MFRNIFSNCFILIFGILSSLVITPILVSRLGPSSYGMWVFLNGLLIYADILYFGLGSALVRYVSAYREIGDHDALNRIASTVLCIYALLGIGCFLVFLVISPNVGYWTASDMTALEAWNTRNAFLVLGVQLMVVFLGSGFSGILQGCSRFDLANFAALIRIIARFVLVVWWVEGQYGLIRLAASMCIAEVLGVASAAWMAHGSVPSLRLSPRFINLDTFKLASRFGLSSFVILISVKLISYTDTLIIGVTIGPRMVSYYSVALQMTLYAVAMTGGACIVFLPKFTSFYERGESKALRDMFVSGCEAIFFLAAFLTISIGILGPAFIEAWIGADFGNAAHLVLPILGVATCVRAVLFQFPLMLFQAQNRLRVPAILAFCEALLNLVLTLVLVRYWGIVGVAMGTLLASVAVEMTFLPLFVCRLIDLRFQQYLSRVLLPGLMFSGLLGSFYLVLNTLWPAKGMLVVISHGAAGLAFAMCCAVLLLPREVHGFLRAWVARFVPAVAES